MKLFRNFSLSFLILSSLTGLISCNESNGVPPSEPTATASPASTATINNTASITITFSDSMDTATLLLTGTMAGESDGGVWSTTTTADDTLTVTPNSSWSEADHTLIIDADDVDGDTLATLTLNYTVDAPLPVASILPANGSTDVAVNESIIITFNETMDTSTLAASGSLWTEGDGGTWSTSAYSDDTLTVTPSSLWSEGAQTLDATASDMVGNSVAINLSYTVAASCSDGIQNQDETDVDCGGSSCTSCAINNTCITNNDCSSNFCNSGTCIVNPCPDADNDGSCDQDDCAPDDPTIYPGAIELCNGIDDDCISGVDNNLVDYTDPANCTAYTCSGAGGWVSSALSSAVICRAAATSCDIAEYCDGSTVACPGDALVTAGTLCADDGNACTVHSCDASGSCLVNNVAEGTSCDDGDANTINDYCSSGECISLCTANEVGLCGDGLDNDCDGLVDLDDTDCP